MSKRIEHYTIQMGKDRLLIIQDQNDEMKRALALILLMLIGGVVAGPYGMNVLEEFFSTGVFWIWTIGWCVSGCVAYYALHYKKEFLLKKTSLKTTVITKGNRQSSESILIGEKLKVRVLHQVFTQGPQIPNTPIRLGTATNLKIFPYTIWMRGKTSQEIKLSLSARKSVDAILELMKDIVELEIEFVAKES